MGGRTEVMFAECSLEHVNGIRGRALTALSLRSSKGGRTRPAVGEWVGGELGQSDPRRAQIFGSTLRGVTQGSQTCT